MKTLVVKNSIWTRKILQDKYHYVGFNGGRFVSKDVDNNEYLIVYPLDRTLINPIRTYMSVDSEYYNRYLKDNPNCQIIDKVFEFVEQMNIINGI